MKVLFREAEREDVKSGVHFVLSVDEAFFNACTLALPAYLLGLSQSLLNARYIQLVALLLMLYPYLEQNLTPCESLFRTFIAKNNSESLGGC